MWSGTLSPSGMPHGSFGGGMSSDTDDVGAHAGAVGDDLASLAAFQDLILERTHDLITIIDPSGTIVYGSPSWQALGWDPDRFAGRAVLDLVHPDDREPGARAISDVLAGGSVEGVTVRLRSRDGAWVWYESAGAAIAGANGAPADSYQTHAPSL